MTENLDGHPQLFIINLERSGDRRKYMSDRLNQLSLGFEFYDAVDGAELTEYDLGSYNCEKRLKAFGCDLTPNEIGCYLSHYRLYEKIMSENIQQAVIMEDDVEIADDFPKILHELNGAPDDWEFIRLAGTRVRKGKEVAKLAGEYRVVRLLNTASGAQAYLINLRGAKKLLKYGREITRQLDMMIDRYWENGLRIMAVLPYPVGPCSRFRSTIGLPLGDVWRHPGKRMIRVRTKTAKLVDGINKRLYNLRIHFG